jgi:centromeric protein E
MDSAEGVAQQPAGEANSKLPPGTPTPRPKKRTDAIQVGIRCRPLIGRDAGQVRCFDTQSQSLTVNEAANVHERRPWLFDNVFDESATVHDIHERMTSEVVGSVMDGYHGTIFAYGQTGSGKTYTMVGDRAQGVPGVMTLAVNQMFAHIKSDSYRDYMVRVSYMEIYNERVRDLLNPLAAGEEMRVRHDAKKGFYVECNEVVVTNDEQIYAMLDAGNELRTTAATNMNAQSSRSHAIFRVAVESVVKPGIRQEGGGGGGSAEDNAFHSSYLNLVDLAGSERTKSTGASGQTLKEAGAINQSLMCLSNIVRMLSEKKKKVHLPFRDSKLTQLLQPR